MFGLAKLRGKNSVDQKKNILSTFIFSVTIQQNNIL